MKNTEWVVGFAVFTGNDTKLMKNSQRGRHKQSKMEFLMNRIIIFILFMQLTCCVVVSVIGTFWNAVQ